MVAAKWRYKYSVTVEMGDSPPYEETFETTTKLKPNDKNLFLHCLRSAARKFNLGLEQRIAVLSIDLVHIEVSDD